MAGKEPGLVDVPQGQHLRVRVVLVDANNGLVRALRATSWKWEFVEAVRAAIERQLAAAGPDQAEAEIQDWYARYTDTPSLVVAAAIRSDDR